MLHGMISKIPGLVEGLIASRILADDQLLVVHGVWNKMIFKFKTLQNNVRLFSLVNSSSLLYLLLLILRSFRARFFRFRFIFLKFRFRSSMAA